MSALDKSNHNRQSKLRRLIFSVAATVACVYIYIYIYIYMYMTNKQISQAWPDYKQTNMYVFSFYLLQHDNLLEGRVKYNQIAYTHFTIILHKKDQSPAKVIPESSSQTAYLLPLKGHPNHSTSACCHYTKHPSKRRGNRTLPHNHKASCNNRYTTSRT